MNQVAKIKLDLEIYQRWKVRNGYILPSSLKPAGTAQCSHVKKIDQFMKSKTNFC